MALEPRVRCGITPPMPSTVPRRVSVSSYWLRTAIVLAAHGSRSDPSVQERYESLAARLQARGVADEVVVAYHAVSPGLDASLDRVAAARIAVVPMLTSDGYFNRVVLPTALRANARASQPGWRILHRGCWKA